MSALGKKRWCNGIRVMEGNLPTAATEFVLTDDLEGPSPNMTDIPTLRRISVLYADRSRLSANRLLRIELKLRTALTGDLRFHWQSLGELERSKLRRGCNETSGRHFFCQRQAPSQTRAKLPRDTNWERPTG